MRYILLALTLLTLGVGCAHKQKADAEAVLVPVKGEVLGELGLMGDVKFTPVAEGVEMNLDVRGLPKGKTLASHIHENGKCDAPSFQSAGSHFNPHKQNHGQPGDKEHHIGDLGNQEVSKTGVLQVKKVYTSLSLDPTSPDYIGKRALIIHAKADDFSQPVGNAGGRLACAVLQ